MVSAGSVRLSKHIEKKGLTLAAFAERVGTRSKALVWSWREGLKVPGIEYALKIEKETGIPPSAWVRPPR